MVYGGNSEKREEVSAVKYKVTNAKELAALVEEFGFLPLFESGIPGFSVRAFTPEEYWFKEDVPGPWEWREQIAAEGEIAYGKLFGNKAGFVSRAWLPDFANYRRDGYDFDARWEDELASYREKQIMDAIEAHGPLLSHELKELAGFGKDGLKGFDGVVTRLQMRTYLVVRCFEYKKDKHGTPYGWGVARYETPERIFGEELLSAAYSRDPSASFARMLARAKEIVPDAPEKKLISLLR